MYFLLDALNMRLFPLQSDEDVGKCAAAYIITKINNYEPTPSKPFVLGLPTGSTPLLAYKQLIRKHKEGKISFMNVVTFNMDEYIGLPRDHPESYWTFMHSNFFDHIDIKKENINILNGNTDNHEAECARYEEKIKSYKRINLFMGGVGQDGHIAFNEPGSSLSSRTRIKTLMEDTRIANARFFGGNVSQVSDAGVIHSSRQENPFHSFG